MNEEEPSLFSAAAEALIPIYPSMPNSDDVHPDLVGLMHKCWNGMAEQRPDATLARKITDATLKMYAAFLFTSSPLGILPICKFSYNSGPLKFFIRSKFQEL